MAPTAELHARALVVCLCVAAALAAQAPREKILSLKVPYYSAREVTTYSPAAASSAQLPLVLMLRRGPVLCGMLRGMLARA
jgi:hypothetical protein